MRALGARNEREGQRESGRRRPRRGITLRETARRGGSPRTQKKWGARARNKHTMTRGATNAHAAVGRRGGCVFGRPNAKTGCLGAQRSQEIRCWEKSERRRAMHRNLRAGPRAHARAPQTRRMGSVTRTCGYLVDASRQSWTTRRARLAERRLPAARRRPENSGNRGGGTADRAQT